MFFLYNIFLQIAAAFLKIAALFSPKIKLFLNGRKLVFKTLASNIQKTDKTIWFHAASLGEYEQGLPVIEKIKSKYSSHKIVLTFFSPSGFEVRKNNKVADVTVYLPLDSKKNVQTFLDLVHPEMVFFIKYEYWPNYLNELKNRNIRTFLISGIFRPNQLFFKWYGGFYRNALLAFEFFFVQNEISKNLLQSIEFQNIQVSGDTRFDRVSKILNQDNSILVIANFAISTSENCRSTIIVIGSSWPKDESLLVDFINTNPFNVKFIIAPHNINENQILDLKNSITKKTVLYSEIQAATMPLTDFDVLIVNTIGILTKIYSYADIAYVGGGFGTSGLHNILEPAAFGIPVIIGPNFKNFSEAVALVNIGGCLSVNSKNELEEKLTYLIQNEDERHETGHIAGTFVNMNKGATDSILNYFFE